MKTKNNVGFTVIELLITLIVIGVVFLSFTITYTGVQNIGKKSTDVALASSAAFSKLQEYENKSFQNLPATTPTGTLQQVEDFSSSLPAVLEKPRTGIVYVNTASTTLKQVVVKVSYGAGSTHYIEYDTFIQAHGVGR